MLIAMLISCSCPNHKG